MGHYDDNREFDERERATKRQANRPSYTPWPKDARYELRVRLYAAVDTKQPVGPRNQMTLVDILAAKSGSITELSKMRKAMEEDRLNWSQHPHIRAAMDAAVALHPELRAYLSIGFTYLAA